MSWSLHVIPVPHDPRELTAALGLLREHLALTLAQSHGVRNHRDCPEREVVDAQSWGYSGSGWAGQALRT